LPPAPAAPPPALSLTVSRRPSKRGSTCTVMCRPGPPSPPSAASAPRPRPPSYPSWPSRPPGFSRRRPRSPVRRHHPALRSPRVSRCCCPGTRSRRDRRDPARLARRDDRPRPPCPPRRGGRRAPRIRTTVPGRSRRADRADRRAAPRP
jgi:hypothetical protein